MLSNSTNRLLDILYTHSSTEEYLIFRLGSTADILAIPFISFLFLFVPNVSIRVIWFGVKQVPKILHQNFDLT